MHRLKICWQIPDSRISDFHKKNNQTRTTKFHKQNSKIKQTSLVPLYHDKKQKKTKSCRTYRKTVTWFCLNEQETEEMLTEEGAKDAIFVRSKANGSEKFSNGEREEGGGEHKECDVYAYKEAYK